MNKKLITSFVFSVFATIFLVKPNIIAAADPTPTPSGTPVATQSGSPYNVGNYPSYGANDDLFFVTPIKNIIGSNRTVEDIREELALSGYEAYCAAEDVSISPQYNTDGLIKEFLEQHPGGISIETDSVEKLSLAQAQYPLWRDVSNKRFLLSSLEEYFGFKDVYEENPSRSEITSAAINSLLSQKQSCAQGWRNLVVQETACKKLENPGECALLPRTIPGTSFSVKTLIDELEKFKSNYEGKEIKGCEELFSDLDSNKELRIGLINTPTYFDRAYRYGFIVAAIHTKEPEKSGSVATKIFNFFTNETENGSPEDEVLVAAFKLPDIGTNKGGEDSAHEYWDDSLDLTRMVLSTSENNKIHTNEKRPTKRDEILENAIDAHGQSSSSKIYCSAGTTTTSCQNELPRALTDLINGNAGGCGEAEAVNFIRDAAGFGDAKDTTGKVFNSDNGGQVLLNLFAGSKYNFNGEFYDPQNARSEISGDANSRLKTIFSINPDTYPPRESETSVDFYVVYPMGFELGAIETAIKGAFFTKAQIETMDADSSIIENFEMTNQEQTLEGGSVGWEFIDTERTERGECGVYGRYDPLGRYGMPKPCYENVKISIQQDESEEGINILGGRLGWWLRKVQTALSSSVTYAHDYYKSCENMEEFLLGRCSSTSGGETPKGPSEGEKTCGELRDRTIRLPSMNELMKMTCSIAGGNANKAQLLWGMMQVDGSPFLREVVAGNSSMSCGDILINTCGASQIVGVLIPQCIDKAECPQAAYIADNKTDPWIIEARENPDVACDVGTQMDYIMRKRLSEVSWLKGQYEAAHGVVLGDNDKQLFYMMAGRNYGVPAEYLVQPACGGYGGPVSGCGGASYCECVMDTFPFSCGNIK